METLDNAIIPLPDKVEANDEGVFVLKASTPIYYMDDSLCCVAQSLSEELQQRMGISLKTMRSTSPSKGIIICLNKDDSKYLSDNDTYGSSAKRDTPSDEEYVLEIKPSTITVTGKTPEGVYRGVTFLCQIVGVPSSKSVALKSQTIQDAPLFGWRGLSLDMSRHFWNVDEVCRIIDMMSTYKMNVLHLHLTDNQGWRLEIKGYPALTEGVEHLSQDQYSQIVSYAASKFVTVVPEFDLPGHTEAVLKAIPSLPNAASLPFDISLPGQSLASLDPDDEPTMTMVKAMVDQICSLTPGEYIHIGGDETFGMNDDKYTRFIHELRSMVTAEGKKVVGWQEMARADLGDGDIAQHWIRFSQKQVAMQTAASQSAASQAVSSIPAEVLAMLSSTYTKAPSDLVKIKESGAKMLLSPNAFAYLDCPYESNSVDDSQNEMKTHVGLSQYAPQNLEDFFLWNPTTLYPEFDYKNDIAGVEAAVWCETVKNEEELQFLLLPRLSEVAEKAWSGDHSESWDDFAKRLSEQSPYYKLKGWNFFQSDMIDWK